MLPEYEGSYRAHPQKCCVSKTKNGAVELAVEFAIYELFTDGAWQQYDASIVGRFYLITKDGQVNERQVSTVEDVFGWDRRQGTAWFSTVQHLPDCQIACEFESYEGKQKLKVQWLNAVDREPYAGVGKSKPEEVQAIDRQFGALFRSTARTPAASANSVNKEPIANAADLAKREAWDAFKLTLQPGDNVPEMFKKVVADYFQGADPKALTAAQWKGFKTDGFKLKISPISAEPVFTDDELPF